MPNLVEKAFLNYLILDRDLNSNVGNTVQNHTVLSATENLIQSCATSDRTQHLKPFSITALQQFFLTQKSIKQNWSDYKNNWHWYL